MGFENHCSCTSREGLKRHIVPYLIYRLPIFTALAKGKNSLCSSNLIAMNVVCKLQELLCMYGKLVSLFFRLVSISQNSSLATLQIELITHPFV